MEKSKKVQIDKISKNKIYEFIWNEQFFFTMVMPKSIRIKQFKLLCDILNDIPCYSLKFPIEGIIEENIRSVPNFN